MKGPNRKSKVPDSLKLKGGDFNAQNTLSYKKKEYLTDSGNLSIHGCKIVNIFQIENKPFIFS